MVNEKSYLLGSKPSGIRELFEYGRKRAQALGRDAVCDFSLGNPSTPPPEAVRAAYMDILQNEPSLAVHGYTPAPGADELRGAVAASLSQTHRIDAKPENLYITCGAASALTSVFAALTADKNSEFVAIAPYFPEYKVFSEVAGGKFKTVAADEETFQVDFARFAQAINPNTRGVIVNSPNNPSGAVYTEKTIRTIAGILKEKSALYGHPIFIVADEPYREIVYDDIPVPFIPNYYDDTIVCYSYSKKLSLPGERIGYAFVNGKIKDWRRVFHAVAGSARMFGYVCAPSAVQKVIARCADVKPDLAVYKKNRDLLYAALTETGYFVAKPDGAFYLFVKSPKGDGGAFSEAAKEKGVLIVPGEAFGCPGFARLSYCVDTAVCERAALLFRSLYQSMRGR